MKTAIVNFKADPRIKAAAAARAKKLGIPLSTVLYGQLSAFAQGAPLRIEFPAEPMTPQLEALIAASRSEESQKQTSPNFKSTDIEGMRRWLESSDDD